MATVPPEAQRAPVRVVIDTNVVVSALLFNGVTLRRLREYWQSGVIVPLVSRETAQELIDVLGYPKFKLDAYEQNDVLAAYLPYCESIALPTTKKRIPSCRDVNDQPFLVLTVAARADALVTGDRDLLALKGQIDADIFTSKQLIQRLV